MLRTSLNQKINSLPLKPGVYLFKDSSGTIIYVGKSVALRNRVKSYFANMNNLLPKTKRLVEEITDIDYIETESEIESLLLEARLIKKHKPFYNIQGKDDKRAKYIKVQNAAYRSRNGIKRTLAKGLWPWVTTARTIDDKDALFFGPFPAGNTVNRMLKVIRHAFPWCAYKSQAQLRRAKKPCFYSHIELCPGICSDEITLREYWEIFDNLVLFLRGRRKKLQQELATNMKRAASKQDFEKAAYYRDTLAGINYITQKFRDGSEYLKNPNLLEDLRNEEISELLAILKTYYVDLSEVDPREIVIEGYDISNFASKEAVGSRVVFKGGDPLKSLYRRYRIKRSKIPDDYAAMREIVERRIKGGETLPDLVLVDGGVGHVSTVINVMNMLDVHVPVIGLAKKHETLIIALSDSRKRSSSVILNKYVLSETLGHVDIDSGSLEIIQVTLSKHSAARRLMQRIRDEAHRFANSYRKKLNVKMFDR